MDSGAFNLNLVSELYTVAREKFVAHRDETDFDRVAHIIERSRADVAWVVDKVRNNGTHYTSDSLSALLSALPSPPGRS